MTLSIGSEYAEYLPAMVEHVERFRASVRNTTHSRALQREVAEYLSGDRELPPYDKNKYDDRLDYFRSLFGKYLSTYRDDGQNYIFRSQLVALLGSKFVNNLLKWIPRQPNVDIDAETLIPTKKDANDIAIQELKSILEINGMDIESVAKILAAYSRR